ncbi:type II toxin-antitoxin system VapC family toxin [Nocardia sp. NPDC050175]|uniref:type II toxin-antitoxin system VapC family toxin n=1 Tax=Nocardia sp. NPDC050175 TaxID=3364317 RepID=UPI0037B868DF
MILYLDASAIITETTGRPYAGALNKFTKQHQSAKLATSTIGFVESVRGCDDIGSFPGLMQDLNNRFMKIPLTDSVCDLATYLPRRLKTADAIHVASAMQLERELLALVTYDDQMADVAHELGLPVAMPGKR